MYDLDNFPLYDFGTLQDGWTFAERFTKYITTISGCGSVLR